ncbi:MAG: hypothetical protein ACJ77A_15790 [Actinomycetota bacterium]
MDPNDLRSLERVLTYGTPATRRSLAERMAGDPESDLPHVLMATVRSSEPTVVRERCLEVLVIMAAAGHALAATVVAELSKAL